MAWGGVCREKLQYTTAAVNEQGELMGAESLGRISKRDIYALPSLDYFCQISFKEHIKET